MNLASHIFGCVVSELDDKTRSRVMAEMAGLEHSYGCVLGTVFFRDMPSNSPEFIREAKKLADMLEMELINVGNAYHPDHVFYAGFEVIELADELELMNEESGDDTLLNEDGPYPEFNIAVEALRDQYEAEFAELAKNAFGVANVKMEAELVQRYQKFRVLSYRVDGIGLPVAYVDEDSDIYEIPQADVAFSSATGKPADEFA